MIEKIFLFFRDIFYIAAFICMVLSLLCLIMKTPLEILEGCFGSFVVAGLIGTLLNYIYENI